MDILQSIVTAAPYMMKILKDEVTMGVIDREKFLLYLPSKDVDFQIRTGDPIKPDDQNMKNALRGETSSTFVPESVYGTPLNAMGLPIFDENQQVIGAIALGFPLKNQIEGVYGVIERHHSKYSRKSTCGGGSFRRALCDK
nr:hypothetical protein [Bacillus altitudinis]